MRRNTKLLFKILNATVAELVDPIFVQEAPEMRIPGNMGRSRIRHNILNAFKRSTLDILAVVVKHFIGEMAPCEELRYGEFWDATVDKKPRLIRADIIKAKRTKPTSPFRRSDPARESDLSLNILKPRILLGHLNGLRNEICTFKQFCHNGFVTE